MIKNWLYVILMLISPELFAGIFDPPPSDQSVQVLGMIFGSNIGSVYLGGVPNPIMSQIMEKFNFIIVAVGTVVVSYVSILSVINTAQEGEAMGKRWSAVWIPIRSVIGMALMIPSPASGYSLIQVTVMWIILQGIGAADMIWNIALDGLAYGASATIGTQLSSTDNSVMAVPLDANNLTKNLLSIAICMEAMNEFSKGADHTQNNDWLHRQANYIKHYTGPAVVSIAADGNQVSVTGNAYFGIEDANDPTTVHTQTCGYASVNGTANVDDFKVGGVDRFAGMSAQEKTKILTEQAQLIYDTKQLAISSMMSVLQPLAQSIVKGNIEPQVMLGTIKRPANIGVQLKPQGYKYASNDAYVGLMSGLIVPVDISGLQQELKDAIKVGKQKGWVVAGSYYFIFNRSLTPKYFSSIYSNPQVGNNIVCDNACVSDLYSGTVTYNLMDNNTLKTLQLSDAEIQAFNTYLGTGTIYLNNDAAVSQGLNFSSGLSGSSVNPIVAAFAAPLQGLVNGLISTMSNTTGSAGGDVLISHSRFGRDMMLTMEITWLIIVGIAAVLSAPAFIPFIAGPFGLYLGMMMTVVSMILPILALVWTIGAGLAVYAPLIPFMIFTTATVGWLIVVIEAIIAAPLIALGLVTPGGDELGKLETSLMILANIFLRPMLMIFGFLLAGRLYNAIVHLIDLGMLEVFKTINVTTIFSSVLILFVYASFVIGVTNTSFSLIYGLPDKVMRWIGGHASETTDTSPVQQTKAAFSSAASEVGKSGGETGAMAAKHSAETVKEFAENYQETRATNKAEKADAKAQAEGAKAAWQEMYNKSRAEDAKAPNRDMMQQEAKDKQDAAKENTPAQQIAPGGAKASVNEDIKKLARYEGLLKPSEIKKLNADIFLPGGGGGGKGGGGDGGGKT